MKKMISLLVAATLSATMFAQSAKDLAKEQAELNAIHMKMLNAKITKDAKKQAKELKKEGWTVPAGEQSIERQITQSQLYSAELMAGDDGGAVKRFIQETGVSTSGTYNSGYAAARASAQMNIASMLQTEIVSAWQSKHDNAQTSASQSVTVDKFNERTKAVIDETLKNSIPVLAIYRRLNNGNFEVQVRIAYDKKVIMTQLKQKLQKELEDEGDEMGGIVKDVLNKTL